MPAVLCPALAGRGPGLVLLHEIFGITEYMKRRAHDLADLGYTVLVPELFWRIEPNVVLPEDTMEGLQQAMGYQQRFDEPQAVDDAAAALEYLRQMPQTSGVAGVLGFCMGGRLAFKVAAASDPDVVVSYYGSGIGNELAAAPKVTAPIIFHFGGADQFLPVEEAERIRDAFADRDDMEWLMHPGAGHAFDNPSPLFHHQAASEEAWPETTAFLRRYLQTRA